MKYILGLTFLLLASAASADQILGNKTINRIFSEGGATAGFYTQEGLPECKWGIMYIDLSKESGKAMFSIALSAKVTGDKINRIDYTVSSSGTCLANGLHST